MDWKRSFFEVDLSRVKPPDLDPNWQHAHSYSRREIDGWTHQLGDIQRMAVERGYSYEDFQQMRTSQTLAERELGETHHKFYDHDPLTRNRDFVSLFWNGRQYEISTNGHHRVHSAQQMGLRRMPAEVSAPPERMEQCISHGHASSLMHPSDRADFERSRGQTPLQVAQHGASTVGSTPSRTDLVQTAKQHPARVNRLPNRC